MRPPAKAHGGAADSPAQSADRPTARAAAAVAAATANRTRAAAGTLPPRDLARAALAAAWTGIRAPAVRARAHNRGTSGEPFMSRARTWRATGVFIAGPDGAETTTAGS